MEGPKVNPLASDPFAWGWKLFGTLVMTIPPLVSLDVLWILQIPLVLVVTSTAFGPRIAYRSISSGTARPRSAVNCRCW